jgi:quinol monooxygenase YgiN
MYVVIWEFLIKGDSREEFEKNYGPQGTWAQLFRKGKGYLGTDLLRDLNKPGRYMTIDRWTSQSALEDFKTQRRGEYDEIDRRCESLTERETQIGSFELV